ncbi:hypothetical protein BGZ72_009337 [Mortierella alpina]|nr:hypothetical protein BGZ72_009337 [Mortierella alpina]
MEAVLAEELGKKKKLAEVKTKAVASLKEFMAGFPTVVQNRHEENLDNQQDQREPVSERPTAQQDITIQPENIGQQNQEDPNCPLGENILDNNSADSAGVEKLRYVLDLMRVGRFRRAIEDIIGCWDMDDCQVIVQYGVAIFQQQKINEDSGYMSFVKYLGRLMRSGIHERLFDSERHADSAKLLLPDKVIQINRSKPSMILWFYWMNSPYMVTPKLLVSKDMDRDGHLAYLVCYWNPYDTRKLMGKLDADDAPDSSKIPVAFDMDNGPWRKSRRLLAGVPQDRPTPEKKPISFRQTNSGQCCTLALFNFLANQEPSLRSEIVKTILRRTCNDEANYDLYAADQDVSLRSLHYWLLTDRDTDDIHEKQGLEDLEDYDSAQPSGNHMIVIMPFAGYVWEIDSYHSDSPLCLGAMGDDWKNKAQARLQMWTEAAIESRVCNDVHAVIRE